MNHYYLSISELRVGCTILHKDKPVKVQIHELMNIQSGIHVSKRASNQEPEYKPIELTPEVLEACGFEKFTALIGQFEVEYTDYRKGNFVAIAVNNRVNIEFAPHFESVEQRNHLTTILYLHQFQNLYYSLTGSELIYKIPEREIKELGDR